MTGHCQEQCWKCSRNAIDRVSLFPVHLLNRLSPDPEFCMCMCHDLVTTCRWDWLSCGFTANSTQNGSFRRRFPKPICWLGMEKKQHNKSTHSPIKRNVLQHTKKLKTGGPGIESQDHSLRSRSKVDARMSVLHEYPKIPHWHSVVLHARMGWKRAAGRPRTTWWLRTVE